ncbi:hypothetical protein D3Z60_20755 [Lachnospiraceae bacterium]|jgi:hypothetical protein|nr:hypothetical protein [Lachnospiraceae bacterium]
METINSITVLLAGGVLAVSLWNGRAVRLREIGDGSTGEDKDGKQEGPGFKRLFLFLAVYALIAVRVIAIGKIPGGLNQDGAMGAVDAKALADYGTDRFGTFMPAHFEAWGYGQMSVLLSYLTVPFIWLMGLTKTVIRLPMVLASLAGIGAVWGIVKRTFGEKTGLAALLLLAINPWHFMQSRWALDCNLFPHMFVLGVCFLMAGIKRKADLYLSMVFFALCMYCYGVSFYMVPFFLLTVCIFLFRDKKVGVREIMVCLLIYFGIAWPIYGTMLINFMKWDTVRLPFVTLQFFSGNVRSADILFFSENKGQQLLANLQSLVNVVFLQRDDLIWNTVRGFGTMYHCAQPFVILGAVLVMRGAFKEEDGDKKMGCRILAAYWIFALLTGLMINYVNVNRINIIFYIHIIFAAVGISFLVKRWKMSLVILSALFAVLGTLFFHAYFTSWAGEIDKAFYGDFVDAVEFAKEYDCDRYYITPDTQYEGAYQVTEILTLFLFDIDAEFYQGKTDRWHDKEIPYKERFIYRNLSAEEVRAEGDGAYIFKTWDRGRFPDDVFYVVFFGEYAAAIPWSYAG